MKKTLLKLFATIVSILGIIFLQGFIRNYFLIDNRIWFFVQYIGVIILLDIVLALFYDDIIHLALFFKTFKQYTGCLKTFFGNVKQNIKLFIEKIKCKIEKVKYKKVSQNLYKIFCIIYKVFDAFIWIPTFALLWFSIIFSETFYNCIWMEIVTFIFCFLFTLTKYISYKKNRKKFTLITFIAYSIISIILLTSIITIKILA